MKPSTGRTVVRALVLNAILGGALLVSVGGVVPEHVPQSVDAFVADGELVGQYYALVDARIEAPQVATWEYEGPEVSIAAPEKPKPVAKRAVVNNPLPPSVAGNVVLEEAAKYVGTPYLYGGTTPAGFDCSGFVSYVYSQLGVSLPVASSKYWNIGTRVSAADAQPGDIIVSDGHVGIYAGGNLQIDSPRAGKTVQFREIWQTSYIFIRVS